MRPSAKSVDARPAANATDAGHRSRARYYRLALTSDPSYAAYFGTANVLAEKVTLMNRVNQIYNDDLAIELRLVNATESLNLDTDAKATGPTALWRGAVLPRRGPRRPRHPDDDIPGDLDFCRRLHPRPEPHRARPAVGASNYDIGHIALGNNGGGVAYLGVVGGDYKGGGCTGLPEPKGDFFAIDYVAHEMGHQFGGNHTFNGAAGNCGGNISDASVEPGSGSSVMAYAGICGQDNLQEHSDPYFSFTPSTRPRRTRRTRTTTATSRCRRSPCVASTPPATRSPSSTRPTADPIAGTNYTAAGIEAAVETATGRGRVHRRVGLRRVRSTQ